MENVDTRPHQSGLKAALSLQSSARQRILGQVLIHSLFGIFHLPQRGENPPPPGSRCS